MKSCCSHGKYDAANHIEHIKHVAGLQAQLRDHQRHLHYQVGDRLDACLVMLADEHDQIMNSMIKELRDIVSSGCVREDVEPHYQEQNDHPLTYLAYTLELSLSATTALACIDKDTLKELAVKVAKQQTRMKDAEAILALPWHVAFLKQQELRSQGQLEIPQVGFRGCTHQCDGQGCSEQCIYDVYHSQSTQPGTRMHR